MGGAAGDILHPGTHLVYLPGPVLKWTTQVHPLCNMVINSRAPCPRDMAIRAGKSDLSLVASLSGHSFACRCNVTSTRLPKADVQVGLAVDIAWLLNLLQPASQHQNLSLIHI